jgi:NADP-dependent 3-hydroxy acid dehydrogenase YdfG
MKAGGEIYTATKSANRAFSESIRRSVQECGIKVTLVEPGRTGSDMIDESVEEQREKEARLEMMKAEDVAEAVCFCFGLSKRANISSLQIEPSRHQ